ncbi:MAG: matrixin family metalloprotease, partial [Candidatus Acidiferrales bacterium]
IFLLIQPFVTAPADAYTFDFVAPADGACPQPGRRDLSPGVAISRQWSTSLPTLPGIITANAPGTPAQLNEIEAVISQSFNIWTGVSGTLLSATTNPNALAPILRTDIQNACSDDHGLDVDGTNTICFNQSSSAFAFGVLAFTRVITADAPGISVGASAPSTFAGEILDADICFRNDGQAQFATPGVLANRPGAYDLESLLAHEIGHLLGLDHSGIWRALMFPFGPVPGTFLGSRPSLQSPDAPLANDDRIGLRELYPDATDTLNSGVITGRILPANLFALAAFPPPSAGQFVTGIFGAHVVAFDADAGEVIAGTFGGWSCDPANPPVLFDGSYRIGHLPLGHNYKIYAEPFDGAVQAADVANVISRICRSDSAQACTAPQINLIFAARIRP